MIPMTKLRGADRNALGAWPGWSPGWGCHLLMISGMVWMCGHRETFFFPLRATNAGTTSDYGLCESIPVLFFALILAFIPALGFLPDLCLPLLPWKHTDYPKCVLSPGSQLGCSCRSLPPVLTLVGPKPELAGPKLPGFDPAPFFFLWGLHNYHLVRSVNCNQTLMLFFFKTSIHSRQNIQRPLHMEWVTMTDWNCVEKSSNLANKGLDIVYTIKR